jgi:signal peptidase II
MRRSLAIFLSLLLILATDFFLKSYVHHFLPLMGWDATYPYGGIAVFEDFLGIDFSLNYVFNKGAAWGMLSSFQDYLFYARLTIIGGMFGYILFFAERRLQFPLFLIITGALGNILDHLLYGHVIDMFHFRFWGYSFPVFNIADSAIFCGVSLLILFSFFKRESSAQTA